MTRQRLPCHQRAACRRDGGVDLGGGAVRDAGDHRVRRRIDDVEQLARLGPRAADEMAEDALVLREPPERLFLALGSRTVLHRVENLGDRGHWWLVAVN